MVVFMIMNLKTRIPVPVTTGWQVTEVVPEGLGKTEVVVVVVAAVVECTHFSSFKEQYFIHKKHSIWKFIVEIVMINTKIINYIQ